jgi:hypothetical protein
LLRDEQLPLLLVLSSFVFLPVRLLLALDLLLLVPTVVLDQRVYQTLGTRTHLPIEVSQVLVDLNVLRFGVDFITYLGV